MQHAHRYAAVGLDREPQHYLSLQRRVISKFPVVQPVERCLVAVEHNLYFFIGTRRAHSRAGFRAVVAADCINRARRLSETTAAATATASSSCTRSTAATATATATYSAIQRAHVDAAAGTCSRGRQSG